MPLAASCAREQKTAVRTAAELRLRVRKLAAPPACARPPERGCARAARRRPAPAAPPHLAHRLGALVQLLPRRRLLKVVARQDDARGDGHLAQGCGRGRGRKATSYRRKTPHSALRRRATTPCQQQAAPSYQQATHCGEQGPPSGPTPASSRPPTAGDRPLPRTILCRRQATHCRQQAIPL